MFMFFFFQTVILRVVVLLAVLYTESDAANVKAADVIQLPDIEVSWQKISKHNSVEMLSIKPTLQTVNIIITMILVIKNFYQSETL